MLKPTLNQPYINNQEAPAVGSDQDVYDRLIAQLPPWFGTNHPNVDTILDGYVTTGVLNYDQTQYVQEQLRIQTATDNNLDLISQDYFGNTLPRETNENDDSFRNRILATLLQEKATRNGMQNALFLLTGIEPIIFEPWNPYDCAAYNVTYYDNCLYGSAAYPYQCFIIVFLDQYQGLGNFGGYNTDIMPYTTQDGQAFNYYGGESDINTIVTPQNVLQTINLTKVFGTICWVRIEEA